MPHNVLHSPSTFLFYLSKYFEGWVFDMWQVLDMYSLFKDLQSNNHNYQPMKHCIWFTDCFKLLTDTLPSTSTCCKITRNNCKYDYKIKLTFQNGLSLKRCIPFIGNPKYECDNHSPLEQNWPSSTGGSSPGQHFRRLVTWVAMGDCTLIKRYRSIIN